MTDCETFETRSNWGKRSKRPQNRPRVPSELGSPLNDTGARHLKDVYLCTRFTNTNYIYKDRSRFSDYSRVTSLSDPPLRSRCHMSPLPRSFPWRTADRTAWFSGRTPCENRMVHNANRRRKKPSISVCCLQGSSSSSSGSDSGGIQPAAMPACTTNIWRRMTNNRELTGTSSRIISPLRLEPALMSYSREPLGSSNLTLIASRLTSRFTIRTISLIRNQGADNGRRLYRSRGREFGKAGNGGGGTRKR